MTHKEDLDRIRDAYNSSVTKENIKEIINLYQNYTNNFTNVTDSDINMIYLMTKNK